MQHSIICLLSLSLFSLTVSAEEKPNIILIISDDQGYADLSAMGIRDDVSTPNLDRLASEGTRFRHAYASSPICNTSRCGIITGVYQQRFGMQWYGGPGITDWENPTMAELLKKAGYTNGYVGKVHYGSPNGPGTRNFPLEHGFDEFFGSENPRIHYLIHNQDAIDAFDAARAKNPEPSNSWGMGPFRDGEKEADTEGMSTEIFGDKARDFINRNQEKPFFLYLSFNAVHNFTHQLPQEYLDKHGLEDYGDWDPAAEPYLDWYYRSRRPNNPDGRAHYLGQLHYLDQEVGRLVDHVNALGIRENTLIIYMGDNGGSRPIYAENTPLRGSKFTLYEGGIRVPLIISQPGSLPEDRISDNLVSAFDLLPTMLSVAGEDVPEFADGIALIPLLKGNTPELQHDVLHWKTADEWSVRQGDWKLHTVHGEGAAPVEKVELEQGVFLRNLRTDPSERINFAQQNSEILAKLEGFHQAWIATLPKSLSSIPSATEWAEAPKEK